jgi:Right handed beta helix region
MKHTSIIVVVIGLALSATPPASATLSGNARSFVSPTGNDANSCTLAAPCRTFAQAILATNAGGEIGVLGTAGYGVLTIDKAISIVNPGGFEAGIAVPLSGTGITINAGASDAVSLRGLTMEGGGVGQTGIQFNSGGSLTVENCVIRHVTGDGINFFPNSTSNLSVSNTLVADNANNGILVLPSGTGAVTAVFNRVEMNNNANNGIVLSGLNSTGTINATVSDSIAAHNGSTGFYVLSASGDALTTLTVFHSVAANNGNGIAAQFTGATLRIAQSVVTGNAFGWVVSNGGVLASYGDNYIDGNGPNTGSLTIIGKQ